MALRNYGISVHRSDRRLRENELDAEDYNVYCRADVARSRVAGVSGFIVISGATGGLINDFPVLRHGHQQPTAVVVTTVAKCLLLFVLFG